MSEQLKTTPNAAVKGPATPQTGGWQVATLNIADSATKTSDYVDIEGYTLFAFEFDAAFDGAALNLYGGLSIADGGGESFKGGTAFADGDDLSPIYESDGTTQAAITAGTSRIVVASAEVCRALACLKYLSAVSDTAQSGAATVIRVYMAG